MLIIKTMADIRCFNENHVIPSELAKHLEKKLKALSVALEPGTDLESFSLEMYGPFGLMEKGDKNLVPIGLPESLSQIMPEWVSRLELTEELYYILYVMADNEYVVQVYFPANILEEDIRLWLSEQPVEEEGSDETDAYEDVPY